MLKNVKKGENHQVIFMFIIFVFGKRMTDALKDRKAQDRHV